MGAVITSSSTRLAVLGCVCRVREQQSGMDEGAKRESMACKRRLQWPQGPVIDPLAADAAAAGSPAGASCWSPEPAAAQQEVQQAAAEEQQGEVLLRSPTHDGVVLLTSQPESKRARFLDVLDSSSLAGPAAATTAAAGANELAGEDLLLLQQLPPAATSSSRRTWEQLFQGLQQPATAMPPAAGAAADIATPAAATAAGLPLAPFKQHVVRQARHSSSSNSACRGPYKTSRALPGMAPSSAAALQQLRSWLTALEAR
jgi:hypothetical protein